LVAAPDNPLVGILLSLQGIQGIQAYLGAWSQPGAWTAMVNWYRAMFRYGAPPPRNRRILPSRWDGV
jgi:hypothetical protein